MYEVYLERRAERDLKKVSSEDFRYGVDENARAVRVMRVRDRRGTYR